MKSFVFLIFVYYIFSLSIVILPNFLDKSDILKVSEILDEKIDYVSLGTSHGGAFNYKNFDKTGIRLHLAGNTLYYDLQNYRYLRDNDLLSEKAIIIIPVSYFAFGLDENRGDRLPDDSFVNGFYSYLPAKQIHSFSWKKYLQLKTNRLQERFNVFKENNSDISRLIGRNLEKNTIKSIPSSDLIKNELKHKTLNRHSKNRTKHHKRLSKYSDTNSSYEYLKSLIEEAIKSNHRPILTTVPYYYQYDNKIGKELLNETYFPYMRKLSYQYNIPYLNYSFDKRFTFTPGFFQNSDHLNQNGKYEFSKLFFKDIQNLKDF